MAMQQDHLGNTYPNEDSLCKAYHISKTTYRHRILKGKTVEEALLTPVQRKEKKNSHQRSVKQSRNHSCKDHTGQEYSSIKEMCKAWNMDVACFSYRIHHGWDLEKALTTKPLQIGEHRQKVCKDHKGKEYQSMQKMCKAYDITIYQFHNRIALGWTLEKTLTTPIRRKVRTAKMSITHD